MCEALDNYNAQFVFYYAKVLELYDVSSQLDYDNIHTGKCGLHSSSKFS